MEFDDLERLKVEREREGSRRGGEDRGEAEKEGEDQAEEAAARCRGGRALDREESERNIISV